MTESRYRSMLAATPPCSPTEKSSAGDLVEPVALPADLIESVDAWFAKNTGLGGCSDKDVAELAAIFSAPQMRAEVQAEPVAVEPPFLQRLRAEQRELHDRNEKLEAFLKTPALSMLDSDDAELLVKQTIQQHELLQTLNQRINNASGKHMRSKNHG